MSIKKLLIVVILALGAFVSVQTALAQQISPNRQEILTIRELSEIEKLKLFLYQEVGYDYEKFVIIKKVIDKESEWKVEAVGDSGLAKSIAQFHRPTFDRFSEESGIQGEYENPYDQIKIMVWAFDNGYRNHWSAYKTLKLKGLI